MHFSASLEPFHKNIGLHGARVLIPVSVACVLFRLAFLGIIFASAAQLVSHAQVKQLLRALSYDDSQT